MARIITVDEDTLIGYDFETSLFYVTNKNTTTTRTSITDIIEVLGIVAHDYVESHQTLADTLQELATTLEPLEALYYTYSDNGEYIHTIQLNTYSEHPLTLDLDTQKLYIMNSDLIFDLRLDEPESYRIAYLRNYYKDALGLSVSADEMLILYNILLSYYSPHYYIKIQQRENATSPLYYTNTIYFSNPNKASKVECTALYNPYNNYTGNTIANILNINQNTRTIQLASTIPTQLKKGDKILIENAITVINSTPYEADGTYTIQGIDTDTNTIQVEEQPPVSYTQEFLHCYKATSKSEIASISRENFTITLSHSVPNTIQVGDKIHVHGTSSLVDSQVISADGEYTIVSISNKDIVVQEQIPIDFEEENAYVYKYLYLADISTIATNQVTLVASPTLTIAQNDIVSIYNTLYTVSSYSNKVITLSSNPPVYTLEYAHLQERKQGTTVDDTYVSPEVEITVTSSTLTNIPKGSFIVDNYGQAQGYTSLLTSPYLLPSEYESMLSNPVPMAMELLSLNATCLGLYSEVYSEPST